jgi:hypothetical protein
MYTLRLLHSLCMFVWLSQSLNIPFCINCKHFIPNNIGSKYGKCKISPIDVTEYLVTGNTNDIVFNYCTIARVSDSICGKNATKYDAI